jgi:hypothetical protein
MSERPVKIWALFSVDNNYDQPANNLVAWWVTKPSLDVLAVTITGKRMEFLDDASIIGIVRIFGGEDKTISTTDGTSYRLEAIAEGKIG